MNLFDRFRKKPAQSNSTTTSLGQKEEQVDLVKLHQLIIYCFDINELRDLCFDLAVDYEDLPGEAKPTKARELVTFFQRPTRSLDTLIQACSQLRPKAPWTASTMTDYNPYRGKSLVELRRKLVEHFEENELHSLCAKFGVSYRALPDTGSIARELIAYLERRERLDELVEECTHRHPTFTW